MDSAIGRGGGEDGGDKCVQPFAEEDDDDDGDIFASVVNFEQQCFERGWNQAQEEQMQASREQGRNIGWANGQKIGAEIGFYQGIVNALLTKLSLLNER